MAFEVSLDPCLADITIAAVEVRQITVAESSSEARHWCDQVAARVASQAECADRQALRQLVRSMLRYGKFKASGRSKPAQEYLLRCVLETGSLPKINGPVDVLNCISLQCELPISLLSLRKCSNRLLVRRGNSGEGYVFNQVGQILDVTDLVVVCDAATEPSRPVGSPIKDSMAGKIEPVDTELIALIYAPQNEIGKRAAQVAVDELCVGFQQFCQAQIGMIRNAA